MISSINSGATYAVSGNLVSKNEAKKSPQETQSSSESKVKNIAKQIEDGTYKVDIQSLAKKIADELI